MTPVDPVVLEREAAALDAEDTRAYTAGLLRAAAETIRALRGES